MTDFHTVPPVVAPIESSQWTRPKPIVPPIEVPQWTGQRPVDSRQRQWHRGMSDRSLSSSLPRSKSEPPELGRSFGIESAGILATPRAVAVHALQGKMHNAADVPTDHLRDLLERVERLEQLQRRPEKAVGGGPEDGLCTIELVDSRADVYTDILITLASRQGFASIMTSAIMLIAAILLKVFFVWMIMKISFDPMTEDNFQNAQFKAGKDWMNYRRGHRKGWYICNGQDWGWAVQAVGDMKSYNDPAALGAGHGLLFGGMACLMWAIVCLNDVRSNLSYLSLVMLPRNMSWNRKDYVVSSSSGATSATIESLHLGVKSVLVLVFILRLVMTLLFFFEGMTFLGYTETLKDFILNSVALQLVFKIDEMLFSILPTIHQKRHKWLDDIRVDLRGRAWYSMLDDIKINRRTVPGLGRMLLLLLPLIGALVGAQLTLVSTGKTFASVHDELCDRFLDES